METRAHDGIAILVDGFSDNPVLAWVFPDEASRPRALETWFRFWLTTYGSHGLLEVTEDGDGAALWARPGAPDLSPERLQALIAIVQEFNGDRTGLVLGGLAALKPPSEPHWYLNTIAARRDRRARGVGARLLEPFLERSDRDGVPIYLESSNPRNLTFYRRHGFVDLGPRIDLPESGPPLQPMWRAAAAGAAPGSDA